MAGQFLAAIQYIGRISETTLYERLLEGAQSWRLREVGLVLTQCDVGVGVEYMCRCATADFYPSTAPSTANVSTSSDSPAGR